MNINNISFGKAYLNKAKNYSTKMNYQNFQDDSFVSSKKETKKTPKSRKFLLWLMALTCAANMTQCSKMPNTTNPNDASKSDLKSLYFFGNMVDNLDGASTLDYIIEDTEQGKVADCWLLSTVNSLNNTEYGKELIKNMFEYKDGESIVHLYSGDYTITDDELKVGKVRHSKGDDDMLLLELATEKALAEYNAGNLELPEAVITPQLGGNGTFSTLNLGSQDAAMHILLGGKATYSEIKNNDEEVNEILNKFQNRGDKDFLLTTSIETGDKTAINDEGEVIELKGHHAYSVLNVEDNYITVINPEDSSKEYKITIDSFKEAFNSITYLDLQELP